MSFFNILTIAFALSLDAFAVSITCGLRSKTPAKELALRLGLTFGFFQGVMPIGGIFLGAILFDWISSYAHWIVASIFFLLGGKIFWDMFQKKEEVSPCLNCKRMCLLTLGVATSIDAFLIGFSLYIAKAPLLLSLLTIALVTFFMSFIGTIFGKHSMTLLQEKARIVAALLLFFLGAKAIFLS